MTANPYMFVVGAARSGTTLLQRMLDAHPQLAVVNETYWIPRKFRERLGLTRSGHVTPALTDMLLDSPKFDRMGVGRAELERLICAPGPPTYAEFVTALFDTFAAAHGKPHAGDKSPGYVRRIPALNQLWPSARFVHIIRDPRDLALSMVEWSSGARTAGQFGTWEADPYISSALYWRLSVGLGREYGRLLPDGLYHEVRYEDLIDRPEDTLNGVCAFLGLDYEPAMLRYHEGRTRIKQGRSSKAQWLPPTPGLRDWKVQLDRPHVRSVELAAGALMAELGYQPASTRTSATDEDLVDSLRRHFAANVQAAQRPLPAAW